MKFTLIRANDTVVVRGVKEIIINECTKVTVLIGYDGCSTIIPPPVSDGNGDQPVNETYPPQPDYTEPTTNNESYPADYGYGYGSEFDGINADLLDEQPERFPMIVNVEIDPIRQGTFGYDYMARVVKEGQVGFNMMNPFKECLGQDGGWEKSQRAVLQVQKNPSGYYKVRFGCHQNPITMADKDATGSQINVISYNENIHILENGVDTTPDWATEIISGLLVYSKEFMFIGDVNLPEFTLKNYNS